MKTDDALYLMVAPPADVRRDVRKNLPWALAVLTATVLYILLSAAGIRCFESGWSFLHACYFTVINMTTVGFGDVVPVTHGGKIIAGINAFAGLLLFGMLVAIFSLALQPASWSAKLTKSPNTSDPEHDTRSNKDSNLDAEASHENSVADLLESVAKVVRSAERANDKKFEAGLARTKVTVIGPSPAFIEIDVEIFPH